MSEVGKATKDLLKSLKKNIIEEKINEAIVHELNEKEFRLALIDILTKRGSLQLKTAEDLLDEQGMSQMKLAFTHPTMLEPHTYELFETLGDATVNKCIVWYLTRRFPQIKRGESGNEIITEIKKTVSQEKIIDEIIEKIKGFDVDIQNTDEKWLLEKTEEFCKDRAVYNAVLKQYYNQNYLDKNMEKAENEEELTEFMAEFEEENEVDWKEVNVIFDYSGYEA
jgi:dsRNA-specific ribonuclease